jgi:hypothetical protein
VRRRPPYPPLPSSTVHHYSCTSAQLCAFVPSLRGPVGARTRALLFFFFLSQHVKTSVSMLCEERILGVTVASGLCGNISLLANHAPPTNTKWSSETGWEGTLLTSCIPSSTCVEFRRVLFYSFSGKLCVRAQTKDRDRQRGRDHIIPGGKKGNNDK